MNIPGKDELFGAYWGEKMPSIKDLSTTYGVAESTIYKWMEEYNIPRRKDLINSGGVVRFAETTSPDGHAVWKVRVNDKTYLEHRWIVENEMGINLKENEIVHHKDGNPLNNHPLNLLVIDKDLHTRCHKAVERGEKIDGFTGAPWFWNYMIFAYTVAENSHCRRLKVGALIANKRLDQIYGFGYNGNAKGLANDCDSSTPGKCGCIHAEMNALLKAVPDDKEKVMFLTHSPCLTCAKLIINSGFKYLYYGELYRDSGPLKLLDYSGVRTCPYPLQKNGENGGTVYTRLHPTGFKYPTPIPFKI